MRKKLLTGIVTFAIATSFTSKAFAEINTELISTKKETHGLIYEEGRYGVATTIYNDSDVPVQLRSIAISVDVDWGEGNESNIDLTAIDNDLYKKTIPAHSHINWTLWSEETDEVVQDSMYDTLTGISEEVKSIPTRVYSLKTGTLYKVISYSHKTKIFKVVTTKNKIIHIPSKLVSNIKVEK